MPALIPVDNTLGALFIGTVLSSIFMALLGCKSIPTSIGHCSQDRWPLKSFVAFLMLVDTVNLVFCIYTTYQFGVTNFGNYRSILSEPWSLFATSFSSIAVTVSVQLFYAYRIYRLGRNSPYLPVAIVRIHNLFEAGTNSYEQSIISLTESSISIVYNIKVLMHVHDPHPGNFEEFFFSALSCKVLCDTFITTGMVYYLLSNRSQVR
ncbi:hypothetical protein H4582DRAFT_2097663, partial [Lactarius indigo]